MLQVQTKNPSAPTLDLAYLEEKPIEMGEGFTKILEGLIQDLEEQIKKINDLSVNGYPSFEHGAITHQQLQNSVDPICAQIFAIHISFQKRLTEFRELQNPVLDPLTIKVGSLAKSFAEKMNSIYALDGHGLSTNYNKKCRYRNLSIQRDAIFNRRQSIAKQASTKICIVL